jgi:hypothetical protein
MPIFLWVTKAMVLKETKPRTSPSINKMAKLNKNMEFVKKLTLKIYPLIQKLIEMRATEKA